LSSLTRLGSNPRRCRTCKDDSWKRKYKEPAAPKTSGHPELPDGWTWASLDQLSWSSDYGTSERCEYDAPGPPVLRIPNVQAGEIDLSDIKRALNGSALSWGSELSPGDLLIIRTNGSKNLIGRSALVKKPFEVAHLHASYLIRFRTLIVGNWLSDIWDASLIRGAIEAFAATSAGQFNVSMTELATLAIPLPPLDEISRIVLRIEEIRARVQRATNAVRANLSRASSLRATILSAAFSGKLVPQDFGDEPASVLLERIRAGLVQSLNGAARGNGRRSNAVAAQ
jgi:type I restriction enzyme S subunit